MIRFQQVRTPHRLAFTLLMIVLALVGCSAPQTPEPPWDYVALGDSFTRRSNWPEYYAEYIEQDQGVEVVLHEEAKNGQDTSEVLELLRNDEEFRTLISEAEIITINWSIGGLDRSERSFLAGSCGGEDNEACFREAVENLKPEWEEVIDEIFRLRGSQGVIMRTTTWGPWPYENFYAGRISNEELAVIVKYSLEMKDYIAESAARRGILVAEVGQAFQGPDLSQPALEDYLQSDGVHLSNAGSRVIADLLRDLGYEFSFP